MKNNNKNENSITEQLNELHYFHHSKDFESLLSLSEYLLKIDPNNSELLYFKFSALCGLERQHEDLGFLRKLCWYRSTSAEAFWALAVAYWKSNQIEDALISCAYCLSVDGKHVEASKFLNERLLELGFVDLKLHFLTVSRIGHLVVEPDSWFRAQQKNGGTKTDTFHLFVSEGKPANQAVYQELCSKLNIVENEYWTRIFKTRPNLLDELFYEAMPYDLQSKRRAMKVGLENVAYLEELFKNTKPLLSFDHIDLGYCRSLLSKIGVAEDAKVVCLHVRDSGYLKVKVEIDTSYHDFRDGNVEQFYEVIKWLIEHGYTVVRMGKNSNQTCEIDSDKFIDLNNLTDSYERDLLDVVLLQKCEFLIGTACGFSDLAACMGVPILLANVAPFVPYYHGKSRIIPKLYVNEDDEPLHFLDIFDGKIKLSSGTKVFQCLKGEELHEVGIRVQDCDPVDILKATMEFIQLVNGSSFNNPSKSQIEYSEMLPKDVWFKDSNCWVSECYLEKYSDLFFR